MPFVTARTSSSTALILLPHKGISLFRHAYTTKIIGGSGLSLDPPTILWVKDRSV